MKKPNLTKCLLISFCLGVSAVNLTAQSGGTYSISHSVIANGGGQGSTGGTFSVSGTVGQHAVGTTPTGGTFVAQNGFWHADFAPSAAEVSVSGRVTTSDGRGLRNAVVSLTDQQGVTRTVRSGTLDRKSVV